jgi:hypothetical protein
MELETVLSLRLSSKLIVHSGTFYTTVCGIILFTCLDGRQINGCELGPITCKLQDDYWTTHYDDKSTFQIDYGH